MSEQHVQRWETKQPPPQNGKSLVALECGARKDEAAKSFRKDPEYRAAMFGLNSIRDECQWRLLKQKAYSDLGVKQVTLRGSRLRGERWRLRPKPDKERAGSRHMKETEGSEDPWSGRKQENPEGDWAPGRLEDGAIRAHRA